MWAVGSCAIYVSDKPRNHDFDLLRKLVLPDRSILRAKLPGRQTASSWGYRCRRNSVRWKLLEPPCTSYTEAPRARRPAIQPPPHAQGALLLHTFGTVSGAMVLLEATGVMAAVYGGDHKLSAVSRRR